MDVRDPEWSPFSFCGTTRLFKILIFCLILGFLKTSADNFFDTVQILKVEVRKYCGTAEFLTLYRSYIAFY